MTRDEIINLAREAGFEKVVAIHPDGSKTVTVAPVPELEAFAKLVAEREREACAQVCEAKRMVKGGEVFAAAIRARSQP